MNELIDYILENTKEVEINREEISYEKQYDYICVQRWQYKSRC